MKTHISTKMAGYAIYLSACIYIANSPHNINQLLCGLGLMVALFISVCEEFS